MKRILALLLTCALLLGIMGTTAFAAEVKPTMTAPTIKTQLASDGKVTVKVNDDITDYNIYVQIYDEEGNWIGGVSLWEDNYDSTAKAYIKTTSYTIGEIRYTNVYKNDVDYYYGKKDALTQIRESTSSTTTSGDLTTQKTSSKNETYDEETGKVNTQGTSENTYTYNNKTYKNVSQSYKSNDKYYNEEGLLTGSGENTSSRTYSDDTETYKSTNKSEYYDQETGKKTNDYSSETNRIEKQIERKDAEGNPYKTWITASETSKSVNKSYNKDGKQTYESTNTSTTTATADDRETTSKYVSKSIDADTGKTTYESESKRTTTSKYEQWKEKHGGTEEEHRDYHEKSETYTSTDKWYYEGVLSSDSETKRTEKYEYVTYTSKDGKTSYPQQRTASQTEDRTSHSYDRNTKKVTSETVSKSSFTVSGNTRKDTETSESKNYTADGDYNGRSITNYSATRVKGEDSSLTWTDDWNLTTSERTTKAYNKDEILCNESVEKAANTFTSTERNYKTTTDSIQRDNHGNLIATKNSVDTHQDKKKETYWDTYVKQSSSTKRLNKNGTVVYSYEYNYNNETGISTSETKSYDYLGTLTSAYSSKSTKTNSHSENYNRYGKSSESDTTYDANHRTTKSVTKNYDHQYNGKNNLSSEYVSTPEYYDEKKDSEGNLISWSELHHTKSTSYDMMGGVTSTNVYDETYNEKDGTTTSVDTTSNYVGKEGKSELHDRKVSQSVYKADGDYTTSTTWYDWDESVERKTVNSKTTEKDGTVTRLHDVEYSDDGKTIVSGGITVDGFDKDLNPLNKSYEYSEGVLRCELEYSYNQKAKRMETIETDYDEEGKLIGKNVGGETMDKDENPDGYATIWYDKAGKQVFAKSRKDADGYYVYLDGNNKEIGHSYKTDEKGVSTEIIPEFIEETYTLTGAREEKTWTPAKKADGTEYTIFTQKGYNEAGTKILDELSDAVKYERKDYYEDGKTLSHTLTASNDTEVIDVKEKWFTEEGKLKQDYVKTEKLEKDSYYENPGDVLSKVWEKPAATKDKDGNITKEEESTTWYFLDGKQDHKRVSTSSYEYRKGKATKTTSVTEYRNSKDAVVVKKTEINDPEDKNSCKTEYVDKNGKVIGYTKYSGYKQGSTDGTEEILTPEFSAYTGYVSRTTKSVTTWKDGGSNSSSETRDAKGKLLSESTSKQDKYGNRTITRAEYNSETGVKTSESQESYDVKTETMKESGKDYRWQTGTLAGSWESESAYNKDKKADVTTEKRYNADGKLVYTKETVGGKYAEGNSYGPGEGIRTVENTTYTNAKGEEIGYEKTDAKGNYSASIPRISAWTGDLDGSWEERTSDVTGKKSSSKIYDKDGWLTSETVTDNTLYTSTTKNYWEKSDVVKSLQDKKLDKTNLTTTTRTEYNSDGSQRNSVVTVSGRKTGTHFETTKETHYDNKGAVVYTYEYTNDLQKDEETGIYKNAAGKEIGHKYTENEDGSWSSLTPNGTTSRTGQITGFTEHGEDQDGNTYTKRYNEKMELLSRVEGITEEQEEGEPIITWSYFRGNSKNPYELQTAGDNVWTTEYLRNNGTVVSTNIENRDFDSNSMVNNEWNFYNDKDELTFSALEINNSYAEDGWTAHIIYLDKNGKEIGRSKTGNGDASYSKAPLTTYTNTIYGYSEYERSEDGKTETQRTYKADGSLKGEGTWVTSKTYTDDVFTTTTTNKNGMVLKTNEDFLNEEGENYKTVITYYDNYSGRYAGTDKHYNLDNGIYGHKAYDENGNVTHYGESWSDNDWYYRQDNWANGQEKEYSWSDQLGEQGSLTERYNPDGSWSYWASEDGKGNSETWVYDLNGNLRYRYQTTKGANNTYVTNVTYYNADGTVNRYDWGQKQSEDYWGLSAYDSEVWDANKLLYKKHSEAAAYVNGTFEKWEDAAGNIKERTYDYDTQKWTGAVTLKNPVNGWNNAFGNEYYYYENGKVATGWKLIDGTYYYFKQDGAMATGVVTDEGVSYTMDKNGAWVSGWTEDENKNWSYSGADGKAVTGWQNIGGTWYYFDEGWRTDSGEFGNERNWYIDENSIGNMATGTAHIWNGDWSDTDTYFFRADGSWDTSDGWKSDGIDYYYYEGGKAVRGWKQIGKSWYYFNEKGIMKNGWVGGQGGWYYLNLTGDMAMNQWVQEKYEDDWYYMDGSGNMVTGWQQIDGAWYYMKADGVMAADEWAKSGSSWYYMKDDGTMATGWQQDKKNDWYYLGDDGAMKTGWQQVGGAWYYLGDSGVMQTGEVVIDGVVNVFDDNGVWIGTK